MAALTASEEAEYDSTTICKRSFTDDNQKTRHHNHVMGKYLFPACNSCNFALKPRKCKIATMQSNSTRVVGCNDDDDDGDDEWTYLVPIVFYNLSAYDGHFVLQFFCKEYTEYTTRTGTNAYADVGVISTSRDAESGRDRPADRCACRLRRPYGRGRREAD